MANFLGNLGAIFKGQQDYQTLLDQQEAQKLSNQAQQAQLAQIQDLMQQQQTQRARQPQVDKATLDYLTGGGIPPPPPEVQAPAPGQASVPMMNPAQAPAQYGPKPIGPQGGMPGPMGGGMPGMGIPMPPQGAGMPSMPQGGPQMPPGAPQGGMPQAAPIPPYKTVGGPSGGPAAPPPQMGIPAPPPQQAAPAPNSMSLQDAARFIKAQGITDPTTSLQILEKLTPYLDSQAKQEMGLMKLQMEHKDKMLTLAEKIRNDDMISKDRNASIKEREEAARNLAANTKLWHEGMLALGRDRVAIAKTNAAGGAGGNGLTEGGMRVQEELVRAGKPIPKGRRGEINVALLNSLAEHEDGGAGSGGITGAQADYKTAQSTYSSVQKRSAGIELGVKKLEKDIDLLKSTMNKGNAGFATVLNQPINYLRRKGSDPALAAYALAAGNVAVEFERLRTGGMLSAAQLHAGAAEDAKKIVNGDMSVEETLAVIPVMMQEIENGRQAAKDVEQYYKDELHGKKPDSGKAGSKVPVFSNQAELAAAIKSGKVKKGDTFNDPSGASHTVN